MQDKEFVFDTLIRQITEIGSLMAYLVFTVLAFFVSKAFFGFLLISLIINMTVAIFIKRFYFKDRPKKQSKATTLQKIDASSFPSIHAMRTTSLVFWLIALPISAFATNLIAQILLVLLLLVICYTRIYMKKHDVWDVLFGILFSVIINALIYGVAFGF